MKEDIKKTGPIDEVQALRSIFHTFFNTSQKSQKQQKDVLVSMSEHETSLNPFHIFEDDDKKEDLHSDSVFMESAADSNLKHSPFGHLEKKKLGATTSHRTVDHTHTILIDDQNLDPVREEIQEEDYEITALDDNLGSDQDSDDADVNDS